MPMVLKREQLFKTVVDGLNILRASCEGRGKHGLTDLHVFAESFFRPFLNEAFSLNLKVLKTGHPAIDLGDTANGVSFQVTADGSKTKVQETLDTFASKKLFGTYPSLKILIIGERRSTYDLRIPKGVTFDHGEDIHDVHTLGDIIKPMPIPQLKRLADLVSAEIPHADLTAKSARSASALEITLNGEVLKSPETTCTYSPDAGWYTDMVLHNTSGEVLEPGDFSIGFVIPDRFYLKDEWNAGPPVHKHPVRIDKSLILYELTQFNRLLPGAMDRHGVPILAGEDDSFETGETIPITVKVHTKYGSLVYAVNLTVVSSDDNHDAIQKRIPAKSNEAAILMLTGFIQTIEGGTKNLPPVSWKRTFSPIDPECASTVGAHRWGICGDWREGFTSGIPRFAGWGRAGRGALPHRGSAPSHRISPWLHIGSTSRPSARTSSPCLIPGTSATASTS